VKEWKENKLEDPEAGARVEIVESRAFSSPSVTFYQGPGKPRTSLNPSEKAPSRESWSGIFAHLRLNCNA
jgi:hypothetical protein